MGLLFEGLSLLPPLCNGFILATFKTSEKVPFPVVKEVAALVLYEW